MVIFFRNGLYIDENIRNANLLISHIEKNNKIVIFISGWNEDINFEDVQLITSGKLWFSINNSDADIKNYLIYINDAEEDS